MISNERMIQQFSGDCSIPCFYESFVAGYYRLYSPISLCPQFNQAVADMLEMNCPFKTFYGIRDKDGVLVLFQPQATISKLISHLMTLDKEQIGQLNKHETIKLVEIVPTKLMEWEEKEILVSAILKKWSLLEG